MQLLTSRQNSFLSSFLVLVCFVCLENEMRMHLNRLLGKEVYHSHHMGVASVYVLKVMIYLRTQWLCEGDAASIHPSLWLRMCSHGTATPFQHHATSEITNPSILGTLILSHGNN